MTAIATQPAPISPPSRQRQQATWASGDYHMIGTQILLVSELLIEALDVHSTETRPRRRHRQRQRRDGRRATRLHGRRHRLRPVPARSRPATHRGRGTDRRLHRGRRRGAAVRRRELRRRHVGLRRDVRARPGADRARARPGHPVGWPDRPRRPHAGRLHRPAVQDQRASTSRRRRGCASPVLWGTEERLRELFADEIAEMRVERRHVRLPLPLAEGLSRLLARATTARR